MTHVLLLFIKRCCFINKNIHYHHGDQRELYTIKPIKKGEELTVFYTVGYDDIIEA